ncbi:hypothetical protein ACH41H_10845 [Streptomyces sp. NPDC020800]|uniref:hypothetical protein n=1 Tax=Streptomyces sp. NPDC020800 TaxID=3365092 RepID=UPI00379D7779
MSETAIGPGLEPAAAAFAESCSPGRAAMQRLRDQYTGGPAHARITASPLRDTPEQHEGLPRPGTTVPHNALGAD